MICGISLSEYDKSVVDIQSEVKNSCIDRYNWHFFSVITTNHILRDFVTFKIPVKTYTYLIIE